MLQSLAWLFLWLSLTEIRTSTCLSAIPYFIIIDANERINITNFSSNTNLNTTYHQHHIWTIDSSNGLFSIVDSYYNLIGVQRDGDVVSLAGENTNCILERFFIRNNNQARFQSLSVDNLKVNYFICKIERLKEQNIIETTWRLKIVKKPSKQLPKILAYF